MDVKIVKVYEEEILAALRSTFDETCKFFPEFTGGSEPRVLGSFGAFGNPASFHNPLVRMIRMDVNMAVEPLIRNQRIHQLFDRMAIRKAGAVIPKKTWHRYIPQNIGPGDTTWGGWLNLDNSSQYFTCVPGSSGAPPQKFGFVAVPTPDVNSVHRVTVPPGYVILFRSGIVHRVDPKKYKEDSYRVYVGFRTGPCKHPIYDPTYYARLQKSPPLPSGDLPRMFSKNHDSALLYSHTIPWSNTAIKDTWKIDRYLNKTDTVQKICPAFITQGLVDVGCAYPEYSDEEVAILTPH